MVDYSKVVMNLGFDFTKDNHTRTDLEGNTFLINYKATDCDFLTKHFLGEYSISLPRFKASNVYVIDVDAKNQMNLEKALLAVKLIVQEIGEPVFLEHSILKNGGFHIYYEFKEHVFSWDFFEKWFNLKYPDLKIECKCDGALLKLPFSKYYKIYGIYHPEADCLISNLTREECLDRFKINTLSIKQTEWFKYIQAQERLHAVPPLKIKDGKPKGIYNKTKKGKKANFDKFTYGAGTRFENQAKIAIKCATLGYTDLEFIDICCRLNVGGSKDMAAWGSNGTLQDNLLKLYRWAFKQVMYKNFHPTAGMVVSKPKKPNEQLIYDLDFMDIVDAPTLHRLRLCLFNLYDKTNMGFGKRHTFVNNCVVFYGICMYFDYHNMVTKTKYTQKRFKNFNYGILLSQKMRHLIAKEFNLKYMNKLYNLFLKLKILTVIKDSEGLEYCNIGLKFAKHFKVIDPYKLISKIKGIFLKIMAKAGDLFAKLCVDEKTYMHSVRNKFTKHRIKKSLVMVT